ncbi:NAD-dependent epimerase/dehydratase family protein [Planktomarina temperata]|nr:NAD-dependent epimerase/dehydratase family protein [Planktomarina temperata]
MEMINSSSKVALTGATGFIGSHLLKNKAFRGALAIGRRRPTNHTNFQNYSFDLKDNSTLDLSGIEIIVHTAARTHIMNDLAANPLDEFRAMNTAGTLLLAEQAATAGVKRFIFISTIKVLGEHTKQDQTFSFDDPFNPQDPYSVSKCEAEEGLRQIGSEHGMEIVIIRPPVVYGYGVKGNFARLLKLVRLPLPLPLRSVGNKRSFVSVLNLVDLIVVCLTHKNAKNQIFLVSDDHDMSTPILFSRLAAAGGYRAYIFSFPLVLLSILLRAVGMGSTYSRLCDSMQVNIDHTKSRLSWVPPFKIEDTLRSCWRNNN